MRRRRRRRAARASAAAPRRQDGRGGKRFTIARRPDQDGQGEAVASRVPLAQAAVRARQGGHGWRSRAQTARTRRGASDRGARRRSGLTAASKARSAAAAGVAIESGKSYCPLS